jgi:hypothetical protein
VCALGIGSCRWPPRQHVGRCMVVKKGVFKEVLDTSGKVRLMSRPLVCVGVLCVGEGLMRMAMRWCSQQ